MEVILLSDVDHVGLRGDVVSVARGYARNYLLPRQLAEEATPARVAELQKRDAQRARHEAKTADQAREIAEALSGTVLRFDVKAGPTGSLFGSVTPTDIADELWTSKKIRVDRRKIEMETIKRVGRHTVSIELFTDVTADLHLAVAPEGEELPTEDELAAAAEHERAEHEAAGDDEPSIELEEVLAEVDAAEVAETEAAEAAAAQTETAQTETAQTGTAEPGETEETEAEAETEPEWRADAEAALAEE